MKGLLDVHNGSVLLAEPGPAEMDVGLVWPGSPDRDADNPRL